MLLVDQLIDFGGQPHLIGTTVVAELNRRGFNGVVIIVSGARQSNLTELCACHGVDMAVCKSKLLTRGIVENIKDLIAAKRAGNVWERT